MVRKANTIQKNFIVTSENVSVQCKNIRNSLSLLLVPLVMFSIISSLSNFSANDLSRVGGKMLIRSFVTTIISITVAFIIPKNIIPILNGNLLPLLFFAFFVGIMTFLLALGLTGYANALICTAMLLPTIGNGIPVSSVGFIVGVYSIIKRFQSAADTAGHIAVAVLVSKSEKEIDTSVYLS